VPYHLKTIQRRGCAAAQRVYDERRQQEGRDGVTIRSMYLRKSTLIALAVFFNASAAEAQWPQDSASDFSIFVTLQRFRTYADHCSAEIPALKPRFDSLIENLRSHVQGISKDLLASERFGGMREQAVPGAIAFAFKDSLDDARHNFQRQDATTICPKTLENLGVVNDDALKSDLTETLAAVQTMIRNLEKEKAPGASPN